MTGNDYYSRWWKIGSLIVISGTVENVSISPAYSWIDISDIPFSQLGINRFDTAYAHVKVSGGGPSYQGDVNTGCSFRSTGSSVRITIQTNKTFLNKTVKYEVILYGE